MKKIFFIVLLVALVLLFMPALQSFLKVESLYSIPFNKKDSKAFDVLYYPDTEVLDNLTFEFKDLNERVFKFGSKVRDVYDYGLDVCYAKKSIRKKSQCCQYNDYDGYSDDGSDERCFKYETLNADLESLTIGGASVGLTLVEPGRWVSDNAASAVRNACPESAIDPNDGCYVQGVVKNKAVDGSGVLFTSRYDFKDAPKMEAPKEVEVGGNQTMNKTVEKESEGGFKKVLDDVVDTVNGRNNRVEIDVPVSEQAEQLSFVEKLWYTIKNLFVKLLT